ncbi:hypothetical protein PoB_000015200 [Plakobranchus ocellatus]|uniref:Uncharacterized protein n=1 Tax=Plakobranchus ocellatus TaxID=259542 RepID=A0AAV3XTU7_9GAST|nr:hypothetical protein PoB_000015200 [Plakobranchus ocellatus]
MENQGVPARGLVREGTEEHDGNTQEAPARGLGRVSIKDSARGAPARGFVGGGRYKQRSESSSERPREEEYGEPEQQVNSLRSKRSRVREGNRQARRHWKHRNRGGAHQESDRMAAAGTGPSMQERDRRIPGQRM